MIDEVRIPYEEYKAINELMHAHLKTHEGQLRALIAFGPLVRAVIRSTLIFWKSSMSGRDPGQRHVLKHPCTAAAWPPAAKRASQQTLRLLIGLSTFR